MDTNQESISGSSQAKTRLLYIVRSNGSGSYGVAELLRKGSGEHAVIIDLDLEPEPNDYDQAPSKDLSPEQKLKRAKKRFNSKAPTKTEIIIVDIPNLSDADVNFFVENGKALNDREAIIVTSQSCTKEIVEKDQKGLFGNFHWRTKK